MPKRITEMDTHEVSLAKGAANLRKFLITKSLGDDMNKEFIEKILKGDIEITPEVEEIIKQLSKEDASAVRGAMKLLSAVKGTVPEKLMNQLGRLIGPEPKKTKGEPPMPEPKKVKKEGELDLSTLPKEQQERVQKELDESKAKDAELEKVKKELAESKDKNTSDLEKVRKELSDEKEIRITKEFKEKASVLKNLSEGTDELGLILKECSQKVSKETFEKLENVLKAADKAIAEGNLFKEIGTGGVNDKSNAGDKLDAIAKEYPEKHNVTPEKAYDIIIQQPVNKELYTNYLADREVH